MEAVYNCRSFQFYTELSMYNLELWKFDSCMTVMNTLVGEDIPHFDAMQGSISIFMVPPQPTIYMNYDITVCPQMSSESVHKKRIIFIIIHMPISGSMFPSLEYAFLWLVYLIYSDLDISHKVGHLEVIKKEIAENSLQVRSHLKVVEKQLTRIQNNIQKVLNICVLLLLCL